MCVCACVRACVCVCSFTIMNTVPSIIILQKQEYFQSFP